MTIFLITELYPADENDHSITHAVKNFADSWTEEVIVFCPLNIGLSTIRHWKRYMGLVRDVNRQISGRKIVFFPLVKIPFFRKYFYWIKQRSSLPSPSVIAGHCIKGNHIAHAMSTRYAVPFSAGIHNHDIDKLRKERKQYSKVLSAASLIACRSHSIKSKLNSLSENRFDLKIFIANSGIEEEQIEDQAVFTRKALELGKQELKIITPARLNWGKNININIDVLSELTQPFKYTIIGEGPDGNKLQKQIDDLKLSDRIEILGWKKRPEVLDYFRDSDLFIMVSAPETFGLTYLEAMAKGCIVIGAIGHGVDGIIQHQKNGFLVEPGDKDALKKVLEEILMLSDEKREKLAGLSRKAILELTEKKVNDAYLDKLKEITYA
jgi:glycosyltransferase involved in cell wall biosynthesis